MDDLSICKRIAEIENISMKHFFNNSYVFDEKIEEFVYVQYNPLTDDALCFQLMVKYHVSLHYDKNDGATPFSAFNRGEYYKYHQSESPNKAICLAIIEAHKDSNND